MKLKQYIKNMSIFQKITLVTIMMIILSSLVSSSFLLMQFSDNIKSKDRLLVKESASRIEDFMQDKYNMMYNQRTLMHSTDNIASLISATRAHPSDIYQAAYLPKITSYLTALCYSDNTILDTILVTADGKNAFSYTNDHSRKIYLGYDYNTLPYIEAFQESEQNITAIYDSSPEYVTIPSSRQAPGVLTFLAKLYDMNYPTQQIITGYLLINFSPDSVGAAYHELDVASDGEYLVVNGDGTIIYSNESSYINDAYASGLIPDSDIILDKTISLSGLRVLGAVSEETLQKSISQMIRRVILVTVASILCMILVITFLHKYYRRKFRQLASAMGRISQGDFTTKLPVTSQDEIGDLSQTFNTMSETLDTYIKKTYLAETQRRTAELYALQAQINPHFLANTIESIRMKAVNEGDYEVSSMLANLGNLFRWMIGFHQDIVYLEDEVDYIESYLDLQKFRFGDMIRVQLDVPPETLYLGIPRFTLQPVVENALTHGSPQGTRPLEISISFSVKGAYLEVTVQDNGIGMDEDTLNELRHHIASSEPHPDFGVALRNVHARIQLLFGTTYGITIESKRYQGTMIKITLPALGKEEMEQYV
ncbi:MAG: sensor histidine kinase [Lachnospiraceae bacterium]|nr:sensor histidine kinase [Lachnospiraceae bacterium]